MKVSTLVLLLLGLIVFSSLFQRKEYEELGPEALLDRSYDVKDVITPPLEGFLFKLVVYLAENPILGPLILNKIYYDSHFQRVRQFSSLLKIPETFYPIVPTAEKSPILSQVDRKSLIEEAIKTFPKANYEGQPHRFETISDYHEAYRSKKTTPTKVIEELLKLSRESNSQNPPLNAIQEVHEQEVLEEARKSTKRYEEGKELGVLDGVPIPIKDEIAVKGYVGHEGTQVMKNNPPASSDAFIVDEMKKQGVIIFGKTVMQEIGIGVTGHNEHWGLVRNAYNLSHYPGGSSSGSGAAVGAGLVPLAIGADGGGSIRIPASFNGAVGLKATYGRISSHGTYPLCPTLGHLGPIGASVQDVAVSFASIFGPDNKDYYSTLQPPFEFKKVELKGLKAGVFYPWIEDAAPEVVSKTKGVIDWLKKQGVSIVNVSIPHLEAMGKSHVITIVSEMGDFMIPHVKQHRELLGHEARVKLAFGKNFDPRDYLSAQKIRTFGIQEFQKVFQQVDFIVLPATGVPPPPIPESAISTKIPVDDSANLSAILKFNTYANFVGVPAIVLPVGYTNNNVPISVQFAAGWWQENLLLNVAAALEKTVSHAKPQFFTSPLQSALKK